MIDFELACSQYGLELHHELRFTSRLPILTDVLPFEDCFVLKLSFCLILGTQAVLFAIPLFLLPLILIPSNL